MRGQGSMCVSSPPPHPTPPLGPAQGQHPELRARRAGELAWRRVSLHQVAGLAKSRGWCRVDSR